MLSDDFSTWLCSINKSLIHSKTNGTIEIDRCITDTMIIFLHTVFIVIILLQLTVLQYWRHVQKIQSSDIYLRYPGHSLRWILAFFVFLIGAASFAEGLLTEVIYRASDVPNAQPHFYLPGIFTISGTVTAMICINIAEEWRFKHMLWTVLCYWTSSLVTIITVLYFDIKVHTSLQVQRPISMNLIVLLLLTICYTLLVLVEAISLHRIAADSGIKFLPKEPWAKRRMFYRENYSNLPSQLMFWWLNFLFSIGFKRPINYERLGTIPVNHTIEYIYARFKMIYDDEKKRVLGSDRHPNLMRTIFRAHWRRICAAGLLKLVADLLSYVGPYALGGITLYVTRTLKGEKHKEKTPLDKPQPHDVTMAEFFSNGFVLVSIVFASSIVQHMCNQTYYYWVNVEGLHAKSAIQRLVYDKSLRLSTSTMSGGKMSMGQVTNHMSADASNVLFFFLNVNEIWAIPVKITVALYLLSQKLGIAAVIAASVFLIVIPLQMIVATTMARVTKSVLKTSDKRLGASNEMLQGIRLLKIYGWEDIFYESVKTIRNSEIYQLLKIYILFAVTFSINSGTPIIVTLIAFAVYTPFNSTPLTPDRAFSSLALFKLITEPLFLLPYVLNLAVTLKVSIKRLVEFLGSPEVQPIDDRKVQGSNRPSGRRGEDDIDDILGRCRSDDRVVKSTPLWSVLEADEDLPSEDDVFLSLEEMDQRKVVRNGMATRKHNQNGTKIFTNGDCVEGLQRDTLQWDLPDDIAIRIQNGSFVWDVTPSSSDVHEVSNVDITIPSGKLTIIVGAVGSGKSSLLGALMGEMTTCSGTVQIHKKKCRMAYAPQKAWLVNTTVRKNILFGEKMDKLRYQEVMQACSLGPDIEVLPAKDRTEIGENGINLSGGQKQRVSVARAMYSDSDIIILDDPLSALDMQVGSDLFDNGIKGILRRRNQTVILVTHQLQYLPQADKIIIMDNGRVEHQGSPYEIARANQDLEVKWEEAVRRASEKEDVLNTGSDTEMERKSLRRQCSRKISVLSNSESFIEDGRGRLIVQEDRESGAVAMSNYIHYVSSMGYTLCVFIFCSTFLRGALQIVTDFWLSEWSEAGLNETHYDDDEVHQTRYYVRGFAGLSVGTLVGQVLFNFLVNAGILLAAKTLHFEMLENLLMLPVRFFDVTPVGRILNRLSSDTHLIDQRLLITINMLMNSFVNMLASIVVNVVVNPVFLGILVPIAVIFVIIFIYYVRTSRELQRIESISRSPVLAHFSETLGGLATIRAFNVEARFSLAITEHINTNITASLYLIAAQRWMGIRLDFLGAVVVLVAGYCSLLGAFYFDIDASRVGLAISYSLMVSMYLNSLVRYCSELELHMNAVERVRFYSELPNECYNEGQMPPSNWPSRGKILVENVSARYAKELDPILHEININIQPGQKIGVCGRSGSGKSSLALALFRFVQIKGRFLIDGIDISTVPLRTLRQRLSIIPQEAMMFTGTIRSNLDPRNTCTDDDLWRSLEISQLKGTVEQLDKGLDSDVLEGGQNVSVGQRQLFCLARAFLKKSRILVMDEATASIDKETDNIIQEVVEEVFRDKTVLTIAHRIDTLLNSDYILTLDEGRVAEFDTPRNLLNKKKSIFASLLQVGKK